MAAFDGITYGKGQALIRMLENYLGTSAFRAGIRKYMTDHAYGNTTTADLWQALETAAGKPVGAIAGTFTEQAGVPLIIVQASCGPRGAAHPTARGPLHHPRSECAPQRWRVPVALGPLRALQSAETVLLADEAKEIVAGRCGEAVKLNLRRYRLLPGRVRRREPRGVGQIALADGAAGPASSARRQLGAAGSRPERSTILFRALDEIGNDDDRAVWEQVIRTFTRSTTSARGSVQRPALQAYARAKLRPCSTGSAADAVGREDDESGFCARGSSGCWVSFNDDEIIAEARRRFASFLRDPAALRPSLRDVVAHLVGENADRQSYDTLLALARKSTNTSERVRYYTAAASARDPALARETLALTLTDELPSTLRSSVINAVASAGEQPELAWDFVQKSFAVLAAKQGPSFPDYFVSNFVLNFSDADRAAELASFAPVHATSGRQGRRGAGARSHPHRRGIQGARLAGDR